MKVKTQWDRYLTIQTKNCMVYPRWVNLQLSIKIQRRNKELKMSFPVIPYLWKKIGINFSAFLFFSFSFLHPLSNITKMPCSRFALSKLPNLKQHASIWIFAYKCERFFYFEENKGWFLLTIQETIWCWFLLVHSISCNITFASMYCWL